jgi:oxygen-independent coproporphyrinogen-3 oxidase
MPQTALAHRYPRYTSFPTAPHFHAGVAAETYAGWLKTLPAGEALSLYVHVPYCESLCFFCGCHMKVTNRLSHVRRYVAALSAEAAQVGAALGPKRRLAHLHFGGGSPTILPPQEIERLMAALREQFIIDKDCEIAVEIDPRGVDEAKLDAWVAAGMTRASLGVQDLDPKVQQAINRVQPFETVAGVVEGLCRRGVGSINIDLVHGLPFQTVDGVRQTIRQVLSLKPDRLALFGYAHVPAMKPHQRLIPEAALPGPDERHAQLQAACDELIASGYEAIGLDHFARPDDALAQAARAGRLHRNFQGYTTDDAAILIGLGPSSISELPQGYAQNQVDIALWAQTVEAGRLATKRGIALRPADHLRRAVIERLMCDYAADIGRLAAAHEMNPRVIEDAWPRLAVLEAAGIVTRVGEHIAIPYAARHQVQRVAACFDDRFTGPEVMPGQQPQAAACA